MRNFLILLLVVFASLTLVADVKVITESPYNIRFQLDTSDFNIETDPEFTSVNVDGLALYEKPGAPQLPVKTLYIAVPPEGNIKVELVNSKQSRIELNKPVTPAPSIYQSGEFADFKYQVQADLYEEKLPVFKVGNRVMLRHHTVVPLVIAPFEYDYAESKINHYNHLEFEVKIIGDTRYGGNFVDSYMEKYPSDILNYQSARTWTSLKGETAYHIPFEKSDFWYKIEVANPGIYCLDSSNLSMLPDFAELEQLRLFKMTKNRKKYRNETDEKRGYSYLLSEVPMLSRNSNLYFQTLNDEVNNFSDPDNSEYYWLTFGYESESETMRLNELPGIENAENVLDFTRKTFVSDNQMKSDIDYVIIYPQVFITQAERLADIHNTFSGKNSLLINQQDCFDLYSGGVADPLSVRDKIEALFELYPETLTHVILLGSGVKTWNPSSNKNKIITFSSDYNDPEDGYAVDDYFVDFSGSLPSLAIGRIPAKDVTMLDFYLDRLEGYLNKTDMGFWRNNFLMHADDEKIGDDIETHSGLNHTALSEETLTRLHNGINSSKVYGLEYDYDVFQNKPDARDALVEEINKGALIWYFIGHGNPLSLGHETYFKYPDDMHMLSNENKLNLFLAASCSVGWFDDPNSDCLAEAVLFSGLTGYVDGDGGSIASIAASTLSSGSSNTVLMNVVVEKIVDDRDDIGMALRRAKLLSGASSGNSRKYNILGDPTIPVLFPEVSGNITNWPDSLRSRQTVNVNGNLGDTGNYDSEFHMYESDRYVSYENGSYKVGYIHNGKEFVISPLQTENSLFEKAFIVPDDAETTKHLRPVIDFHYDGASAPVGFVLEGDQANEYLPNYGIYYENSNISVQDTIDSCYVNNGNTVVRLRNPVSGYTQGYQNFDVYVDAWAKCVVYSKDETTKKDIVTFAYPLQISDDKVDITSSSAPKINLYLDSRKFVDGDVVSTEPLLIAEMEDENGINLISGSGHGIQIIVDDSGVPANVTEGFVYDDGSYTKGELSWQLDELEEGSHSLKVIAFDSFNNPTVKEVGFISKKSGKVSINNMLPYPNPIEKDGHFTFTITESADITITIFTITGKKIRTLKKPGCEVNFNKVYWDGKDSDGDKIANGTYLYKIRAKGLNGSKSSEKTGKVIILK